MCGRGRTRRQQTFADVGVMIARPPGERLPFGATHVRKGKRMKCSTFLMAGLAVLLLSGSSSTAELAPEQATGIWSTAGCGKDGLTLLVNFRHALMIEGERLATRVAVVPVEWVGGSLVLRVKGEAHERVLAVDNLKPCDALPGSMSLLLSDVVTVFGELDDFVTLCRRMDSITARCVAVVTDLIDVTGDEVFSRAELRQAMRAAGFFIAYRGIADRQQEAFVSLDKLLVAQLAASAVGPFVVAHLIGSYDSDGDDAVSPEELLQGRPPEQALQDILAGLAAKAPPAVVSMLVESIPGFQPPIDGN